MNKILRRLYLTKRVPVLVVLILLTSLTVTVFNVYRQYLNIKEIASELALELNKVFIDNENIATAVPERYYELLDNKACLAKPDDNEKGLAIYSGTGEPARQFSCLQQALEFINQRSARFTENVAPQRYFYSPSLHLLYFFSKKQGVHFDISRADVIATRGVFQTTVPNFYDRILSSDIAKKGLSSTKIYADKISGEKAYTLISYSYNADKDNVLGYVYYDHTRDELKTSLLRHLKGEAAWLSAAVRNLQDGGELCFYGRCAARGISFQEKYSDKYSLALAIDVPSLITTDTPTLAMLAGFNIAVILLFITSSGLAARFWLRSVSDPLTALYTRKVLKLIDYNEHSWIILFDVNKFKHINDTFGHQTGDEALKKIAMAIKSNIRKHDMAVRLGGDEFVAHIRADNAASVTATAQRIAARIKDAPLKADKTLITLSVSFGIARYSGSLEETLKEADENMYRQKENNR